MIQIVIKVGGNFHSSVRVEEENFDKHGWIGGVPVIDTSIYSNHNIVTHNKNFWFENEGPMRGSRISVAAREWDRRLYAYEYKFARWLGRRVYYHMKNENKNIFRITGKVLQKYAPQPQVRKTLENEFREGFGEALGEDKRWEGFDFYDENYKVVFDDKYIAVARKPSNDVGRGWSDLFFQWLDTCSFYEGIENGEIDEQYVKNKIFSQTKKQHQDVGKRVEVINPDLKAYTQIGVVTNVTENGLYSVRFKHHENRTGRTFKKDSIKFVGEKVMGPLSGKKVRCIKKIASFGKTGVVEHRHNDHLDKYVVNFGSYKSVMKTDSFEVV